MSIKHDHTLNPVTALEFYPTTIGAPLILAGEGSYLKVFQVGVSKPLCQCKVFEGQAIHGIVVRGLVAGQNEDDLQTIIWGGSSLTLLRKNHFAQLICQDVSDITSIASHVSDWILDVAISPHDGESCVLITAHNTVLRAKIANDALLPCVETLQSPSQSILYSAHLIWESANKVLVAAGTVFGEIIVWQCSVSTTNMVSEGRVLYTFTGHEGSIFGVNISPPVADEAGNFTRLLASCSDDRTIRIWDLTVGANETDRESTEVVTARETGFGDNGARGKDSKISGQCLALAMGHASRIWRVRFYIRNLGESSNMTVLSFGEDSTTQRWALTYSGNKSTSTTNGTFKQTQQESWKLTHLNTFAFHSGKHIWSTATHQINDVRSILTTGGADGKISLYEIPGDCRDGGMASSITNDMNDLGLWEAGKSKDCHEFVQYKAWLFEEVINSLPLISDIPLEEAKQPLPDSLRNGSLTTQPIDVQPAKKPKAKKPPKDAFNRYAFVSEKEILVTTTFGRVLLGKIGRTIKWEELLLPDAGRHDLRSYSIIKGIPEVGLAFLAGASGKIFGYGHESALSEVGRVEGKVADMFSILNPATKGLDLLVTTLGSGFATLLRLDQSGSNLVGFSSEILYQMPEKFVVTSAGMSNDILVLGSRSGSLAAYDPGKHDEPLCIWAPDDASSGDAVTTIIPIPGSSTYDKGFFLTTGRNGIYSIFSATVIHDENGTISRVVIQPIHHGSPPLGPMIEAAWFDGTDLILYGFKSKNFVVWNETKQYEIVNVECGGAHRSYDYSPQRNSNGAGYFVYTKASQLYLHSQRNPSHRIVKQGGHGREIKACAVSLEAGLIATGAEDTAIRIWRYSNDELILNSHFDCLAMMQRHTAGIQHIQWQGAGYLFSSGGNEEFFIWAVEAIPGFGIGVVCEATCPEQSEDRDLRIMSFDVTELKVSSSNESKLLISLAYSDSTIRTYTYSKTSRFNLVATGRYTSSCLMQLRHVQIYQDDLYILTAATDGNLTVWKAAVPRSGFFEKNIGGGSPGLTKISTHPVHQSAIKSLDYTIVESKYIVVATGGDDNALGVTTYKSESMGKTAQSILLRSAHAAAITGLCFVSQSTVESEREMRLVSSSNDQRVKEWSVMVGSEEGDMQIKKVGDVFTSVADVGDIAALRGGGNGTGGLKRVLVVGNGMEVYTVSHVI